MTDELHARAVEAAGQAVYLHVRYNNPTATFSGDPAVTARAAIDAYLRCHAEQGDPLVRVSEVVKALREEFPGGAMRVHNPIPRNPATFIQRRFAPGPEEDER